MDIDKAAFWVSLERTDSEGPGPRRVMLRESLIRGEESSGEESVILWTRE